MDCVVRRASGDVSVRNLLALSASVSANVNVNDGRSMTIVPVSAVLASYE